jgi:hypothetical protein
VCLFASDYMGWSFGAWKDKSSLVDAMQWYWPFYEE